jgi:DegV family protein with EDD domain
VRDLSRDERLAYATIFKNAGAQSGATLSHPHSQLIATPIVPPAVLDRLDGAARFWRRTGHCVYCAMAAEAERESGRLVWADARALVFCPYAPRVGFECIVLPRRHESRFEWADAETLAGVASALVRLFGALRAALSGARTALERTPDQLGMLADAGVVDAGAAGLVTILEGLVAAIDGDEVVDDDAAVASVPAAHVHDPSSRYRWCVGFVLRGADVDAVRAAAGTWGDSVVVVGDAALARVHVHADDADVVLAAAAAFGAVSDPAVSDMHAGIREAAAIRAGGTAIVYDSTADLPVPDRDSWRMVPLTVHFGDEEVRDYVDLTVEEFYARLQTDPMHPRTSQPSPGAFVAVYAELLETYDDVVSIHISSKLSGTCASAHAAAREFPGRVTVIDSLNVSMPLALAVMRAQQALDNGVPPKELPAVVERARRSCDCLFSVPTLEYLQRGGRIGRAQALVGTLLGVRPLLAIEDGEVVPAGKVRGADRVLPALVAELVRRSAPYAEIDVAIAHAADPRAAAELERLVRDARGGIRSVRVLTLGAVIGAHAGPGALGLAYVALD